ncbi:MAG TPA: hypothetical protein VFD70_03690 [Anaerolineae bacterium]|nr:hypothetical protein [Anaerolineae bacterium]
MTDLDQYLAPQIRREIEERYYARINQQARLENIGRDPDFLRGPYLHAALWADHGVVHVRDVAHHTLQVLDTVNGVLIPLRAPERLAFMKSYGVMEAYLHDIGMIDFSHFGRTMHPEYATQAVMSDEFDDIVQAIWNQSNNLVVERLMQLADEGALKLPPLIVLRELLAMANCHSKSQVATDLLNDRPHLRRVMQNTVQKDLRVLYQDHVVEQARKALASAQQMEMGNEEVNRRAKALQDAEAEDARVRATPARQHLSKSFQDAYSHFERDAFQWLDARPLKTHALADDVIDTLRALRCADALRQRGTVLKTSGQYEIFVDHRSADAIYALRLDDRLFLLEVADYIGAGEANIASSELDREGNLRVSFHRGSFSEPDALSRAVYSAALVINDLQADVIESFQRPVGERKTAQEQYILLERVDDNLEFADLVVQQLKRINPQAAAQTRVVPSLQTVSDLERQRYLQAKTLDWDTAQRRAVLARIRDAGHDTAKMDVNQSFEHVKRIHLKANETLIEPGTTSGFAYIPLGEGLEILPLGGYAPTPTPAWIPLGITGIIRGALRNAQVVARQDLELLMIPKDIYMKYWHSTYSPDELTELLKNESAFRRTNL